MKKLITMLLLGLAALPPDAATAASQGWCQATSAGPTSAVCDQSPAAAPRWSTPLGEQPDDGFRGLLLLAAKCYCPGTTHDGMNLAQAGAQVISRNAIGQASRTLETVLDRIRITVGTAGGHGGAFASLAAAPLAIAMSAARLPSTAVGWPQPQQLLGAQTEPAARQEFERRQSLRGRSALDAQALALTTRRQAKQSGGQRQAQVDQLVDAVSSRRADWLALNAVVLMAHDDATGLVGLEAAALALTAANALGAGRP